MDADALYEAKQALSAAQSAIARLKAVIDRAEADALLLAPKAVAGAPAHEIRLDALHLSVVTMRRLTNQMGPHATVADVLAEGEKGLRRFPMFGQKCLNELSDKLSGLGFDLPHYRTKAGA